MLRAVADTNVFISALNFGGICDDVLALARSGRIELFISLPILEETHGVLVRKFEWSPQKASEACAIIRSFTCFVAPQVKLHVIKEDDPDNRILECALEAGADVVVTGDAHLRKLGRYRGTEIQTPSDFLESRAWVE